MREEGFGSNLDDMTVKDNVAPDLDTTPSVKPELATKAIPRMRLSRAMPPLGLAPYIIIG